MTLNYIEVIAPGASPTWTACLLHGILGSGANWRTIARRFVASPEGRDCRVILPDLRGHGDSLASTFGAYAQGPHTVDACAADLVELEAALGLNFDWILGHSFGGKVACAFAESRPETVRSLWLLDTNPRPTTLDARDDDDGVVRVFGALEAIGDDLPPRDEVIDRLVSLGIARPTAMWLGTAVKRRDDGGHTWRFSRAVLTELIADYARRDCLQALLASDRPQRRQRLVRGGRSDRFNTKSLDILATQTALTVTVLADAGHWLHVDDPEGLLGLFQDEARVLAV